MQTTPDFTWLFVKMLAGLILVLGLALVFMRFVLPRTQLGPLSRLSRFNRSRGSDWARVLDIVRIDPHRSLYLVKIVERYFVLGTGGGTGENSLNLITELSATEWEKAAGARLAVGAPLAAGADKGARS